MTKTKGMKMANNAIQEMQIKNLARHHYILGWLTKIYRLLQTSGRMWCSRGSRTSLEEMQNATAPPENGPAGFHTVSHTVIMRPGDPSPGYLP